MVVIPLEPLLSVFADTREFLLKGLHFGQNAFLGAFDEVQFSAEFGVVFFKYNTFHLLKHYNVLKLNHFEIMKWTPASGWETTSREEKQRAKKALTFYSFLENDLGYRDTIKCWATGPGKGTDKGAGTLRVPRAFARRNGGDPDAETYPDHENVKTTFRATLRPKQREIVDRALARFAKGPSGEVWSIHTGFGKTVCALGLVCALGYKTLIIVNTNILMNQWKERIETFVPGARVGRIQGKGGADVKDKDIVIGMMKSLSMFEYPDVKFHAFGFVVVDEVHNICTKTCSKIMFNMNIPYRLGLSATPKRKDGFERVLFAHIGPILEEHHESILAPVIDVRWYKQSVAVPQLNRMGKVNLAKLVTDTTLDEPRNEFIATIVADAVKGSSRKILVFSDRVAHCERLAKRLRSANVSAGLFVGKRSREDLDRALDQDVVCATYAICKEGFDCPALDTLLFATPRSDVVQAVGRILRRKNANVPMVIDVVDTRIGVFMAQFYKRKRWYASKGYIEGNAGSDPQTKESRCLIRT